MGGWYDILLPWMLDDVVALQAAGRRTQLIIGPWTHTAPGLMAAGHREGIAWLRAHLLGDDRLVHDSAVRVRLTGEGVGWRDFDRWPPSQSAERRLHLGPGAALSAAPAPAAGADGYRYDPDDPTPSLGGPTLFTRLPVVDNAPLEARSDVLVYTGPPLAEALEAVGPVHADLWLTATSEHLDVFARVCDVDPAGVSRNVTDGLVSLGPDAGERDEDGVWHVRVRLWPIGHRFAAGHRIRLLVASGAHPRYLRNPGTGVDRIQAGPDDRCAVDVEVHFAPGQPSAVLLPVLSD